MNRTRVQLHVFAIAALGLLGTAAHAGTISFGGRNWITSDMTLANYDGGTTTQSKIYTVTGPNSATARGLFLTSDPASDSSTAIRTHFAAGEIAVGSTVLYDYKLTRDWQERLNGLGGFSDWFKDAKGAFRNASNQLVTDIHYLDYANSSNFDPVKIRVQGDSFFGDPAVWTPTNVVRPHTVGIHVEWSFPSATTYALNIWNVGDNYAAAPLATDTGTVAGGIGAIDHLRLFFYDSEQTLTVSNFGLIAPVPEPASASLLALAGIALLRRRAR